MKRRIPAIVAGGFGVLVGISLALVLLGDDPLTGIYLVILGFPWTFLLTALADAIDPALLDSGALGVAIGALSGALNAVIIYFIARAAVRVVESRDPTK
jgi:hypothetical protein